MAYKLDYNTQPGWDIPTNGTGKVANPNGMSCNVGNLTTHLPGMVGKPPLYSDFTKWCITLVQIYLYFAVILQSQKFPKIKNRLL